MRHTGHRIRATSQLCQRDFKTFLANLSHGLSRERSDKNLVAASPKTRCRTWRANVYYRAPAARIGKATGSGQRRLGGLERPFWMNPMSPQINKRYWCGNPRSFRLDIVGSATLRCPDRLPEPAPPRRSLAPSIRLPRSLWPGGDLEEPSRKVRRWSGRGHELAGRHWRRL